MNKILLVILGLFLAVFAYGSTPGPFETAEPQLRIMDDCSTMTERGWACIQSSGTATPCYGNDVACVPYGGGAQGPAGTNGTNGAVWYSFDSSPTTTHNNGDLAISRLTGSVYQQSGGSWIYQLNIHGTNGSNGTNGTNGSNGTNGTNGTNGADGQGFEAKIPGVAGSIEFPAGYSGHVVISGPTGTITSYAIALPSSKPTSTTQTLSIVSITTNTVTLGWTP